MLIVLLVYPPQVMLGRASEASSVEFTQKQFMQVSTACKSIVLNEWFYIIWLIRNKIIYPPWDFKLMLKNMFWRTLVFHLL